MKYCIYICLFFLISCSTAKVVQKEVKTEVQQLEEKNDNDILIGKKFKLVSIYPNLNMTIAFNDNTLYGVSAVNNYYSPYILDGDIFNILSIKSTKKGGSSEQIKAENHYFNLLKLATSYKIVGNELTIYTLLSSENLVFEEI